jgi:hypothetical protein
MDDRTVSASPELLAANRRLHELRARAQVMHQAHAAAVIASGPTRPQPEASGIPAVSGLATVVPRSPEPEPVSRDSGTAVLPPQPPDATTEAPSLAAIIAALPPHLGWGSAPATAVLRTRNNGQGSIANGQGSIANDQSPISNPPSTIRLYPDIGLGMLRTEQTAPGRLWLLLHHLDPTGRGVLRVDIIRKQLTRKTSSHYLCGKRQLRNLLRAGEGVFWTRDKGHVWLRSAARVAYGLGVGRLSGRPVALPLSALLSGIGEFRAHLYAAFHSGRVKGGGAGMPIARDTLADLSGVGESSQRAYEARLRLRPQPNYAIGEALTEQNKEERAWGQGQAIFELKDYHGEQGKQGRSYLAWQLPNSYSGRHQQRPKGRQRRINRQLKDLVMKGMPGNEEAAEETRQPEKRYYPNGRLASQSRGPHIAEERYWRREGENGRSAIWHPLKGE